MHTVSLERPALPEMCRTQAVVRKLVEQPGSRLIAITVDHPRRPSVLRRAPSGSALSASHTNVGTLHDTNRLPTVDLAFRK